MLDKDLCKSRSLAMKIVCGECQKAALVEDPWIMAIFTNKNILTQLALLPRKHVFEIFHIYLTFHYIMEYS